MISSLWERNCREKLNLEGAVILVRGDGHLKEPRYSVEKFQRENNG